MKSNNLGDFLSDIADAIREKTGIIGRIPAQEFSEKILDITSGGNIEVMPKDVNFYDFDGTLLHSYSVDEFMNLADMPTLPTHELLTPLRWTYQIEGAKSYVGKYGYLDIGVIYEPIDGKTRFYLDVPYGGATFSFKFTQSVPNGCVINYGDGSQEITFSQTNVSASHTYKYGKYILSFDVQDGAIAFSRPFSDLISEQLIERIDAGDNIDVRYEIFSYGHYNSIVAPRLSTYSTGTYSYSWLKAIVIPSVSSIPNNTFALARLLGKVIIEDGPTSIGACILDNEKLTTISLPESITSINSTFENCVALNTVIIPENVRTIGARTFYGCSNLKFVLFLAHNFVPSLSSTNAFQSSGSQFKIVVPDELRSSWAQTTNWSSYASNIITKTEWEAQL